VKPIFKPAISILALTAALSMPARGAPKLMENIHGYTFVGDRPRNVHRPRVRPRQGSRNGRLQGSAPQVSRCGGHRRPRQDGAAGLDRFARPCPSIWVSRGSGSTSSEAQALKEAQDRIKAYAAAQSRSALGFGGGWNQVQWNLGRFPTARELDLAALVRSRPGNGRLHRRRPRPVQDSAGGPMEDQSGATPGWRANACIDYRQYRPPSVPATALEQFGITRRNRYSNHR